MKVAGRSSFEKTGRPALGGGGASQCSVGLMPDPFFGITGCGSVSFTRVEGTVGSVSAGVPVALVSLNNYPIGTLIVVPALGDADNAPTAVNDTQGNVYTLIRNKSQGISTAGASTSLWYSILTTALTAGLDSWSVSYPTSGRQICWGVVAYSWGCAAPNTSEQSDGATNSGTSITLSIGTMGTKRLILADWGYTDGTVGDPGITGSGMTERFFVTSGALSTSKALIFGDHIVVSQGFYSYTVTKSGSAKAITGVISALR